ncbi:hypothetical protein KQH82_09340 [bacterium]|nr:hypothetical protein [bacterium]
MNGIGMRIFIALALWLALGITAGCGGGSVGAQLYRPNSEAEKSQLAGAVRTIYPDDVRAVPDTAADRTVAWPGVISDVRFADYGDFLETTLSIEHHYFLWVENWGKTDIPYTVSPRGEGMFETSWRLTRTAHERRIERFGGEGVGNLVIVYGRPFVTEDDRLVVDASYIREIARSEYTTSVADFGREGEPVKVTGD